MECSPFPAPYPHSRLNLRASQRQLALIRRLHCRLETRLLNCHWQFFFPYHLTALSVKISSFLSDLIVCPQRTWDDSLLPRVKDIHDYLLHAPYLKISFFFFSFALFLLSFVSVIIFVLFRLCHDLVIYRYQRMPITCLFVFIFNPSMKDSQKWTLVGDTAHIQLMKVMIDFQQVSVAVSITSSGRD